MSRQRSSQPTEAPIGLVAGWGHYPIEVAKAIVQNKRQVCCIGIADHASTELASICDHFKWAGVGRIGGHIRYFRRLGVRQVTMAGKLFKADLLFKGSVWKHLPDLCAVRTFGPHLLGRNRNTRDDNLLLSITRAYSSGNMEVCAATEFAPELLVKHGLLAGRKPNAQLQQDMTIGWEVAKRMGGMDIGQSITIKDGAVIAVEAIEGTDACIERTGELCRRGGWTLVKVSKPNQDMRFDVPTIGPQTIQRVHDAGGRAIVIEAGKTIVVQQDETFRLARQHGISIVATDEQELNNLVPFVSSNPKAA